MDLLPVRRAQSWAGAPDGRFSIVPGGPGQSRRDIAAGDLININSDLGLYILFCILWSISQETVTEFIRKMICWSFFRCDGIVKKL